MPTRTFMLRAMLGAGLMMVLGAQSCQTVPAGGGSGFGVPRGSYLQSCDRARVVQGDILVAECPDRGGRFFETDLRLPCRGDITNENGRLACRDGFGGGGLARAPDGPYRRTCRDERVVRGDLLVADCRSRSGRYVESSLRLPCRRDILNDNGRLVCGDRDAARVPDGTYLRTCRDARVVRGDLLVADCRTRSGRYLETSLRLPCRRDIVNQNGELSCGAQAAAAPAPDGPYRRTCRDERVVRGNILVAECQRRNGRFAETTLPLPCRRPINNDDGTLVCGALETARPVPDGSYRRSCRNAEVVNADLLVAQCRTRSGSYQRTSLRLPCRRDIANEGGRLVCGGRDSGTSAIEDGGTVSGTGLSSTPSGAPDGPYQQSCRRWQLEDGGRVLSANCRDPGSGGFVRSSLRLPCNGNIDNDSGRLVCRR